EHPPTLCNSPHHPSLARLYHLVFTSTTTALRTLHTSHHPLWTPSPKNLSWPLLRPASQLIPNSRLQMFPTPACRLMRTSSRSMALPASLPKLSASPYVYHFSYLLRHHRIMSSTLGAQTYTLLASSGSLLSLCT
ncbi:unnamed protein product, partial [Mycena citricolor]